MCTSNLDFRTTLPCDLFNYTGLCHEDLDVEDPDELVDNDNPNFNVQDLATNILKREEFKKHMKKMVDQIGDEMMNLVDDGCDQVCFLLSKNEIYSSLFTCSFLFLIYGTNNLFLLILIRRWKSRRIIM